MISSILGRRNISFVYTYSVGMLDYIFVSKECAVQSASVTPPGFSGIQMESNELDNLTFIWPSDHAMIECVLKV